MNAKSNQSSATASDADLIVLADDYDQEVLEIFIEETEEDIKILKQYLPQWIESPEKKTPLEKLQSTFHTIKGSAHIVGALLIGDIALAIDKLLKALLKGAIMPSEPVFNIVSEIVAILPALLQQLHGGPAPANDIKALIAEATTLCETPV